MRRAERAQNEVCIKVTASALYALYERDIFKVNKATEVFRIGVTTSYGIPIACYENYQLYADPYLLNHP